MTTEISPAASPSAVASTPAGSAGSRESVPVSARGDFTPAQLEKIAQWKIEDGTMTAEEAQASLADARAESAAADAADTRPPAPETPGDTPRDPTAEISDEDLASINQMSPPAAANEFVIPPIDGGNVTPEVVAADKQSRDWLTAAEFDKANGSFVAAEIARFAPEWEAMGDVDRQLCERKCRAQLDRLWGASGPSKLALAQRFVNDIDVKQPGLLDFLANSGAGNNPAVILKVAEAASVYYARRRKGA